jgi:hypothetical protein
MELAVGSRFATTRLNPTAWFINSLGSLIRLPFLFKIEERDTTF